MTTDVPQYIAAIDQGTTSTRCILFSKDGSIHSQDQLEHQQYHPHPGWTEHDPMEILANIQTVIRGALKNGNVASVSQINAVGITNQRETTLMWNKHTGKPVYNAIVWHDTRTREIVSKLKQKLAQRASVETEDSIRLKTGLPVVTYFSASKILWLLEHVTGLREQCEAGEILFGTMDTWILWNLSDRELHVTDVTNASRTLLMNLRSCEWDNTCLEWLNIPRGILPTIRSSSEIYGLAGDSSGLGGVPLAGNLGDQQAALFGQACFGPGEAKSTFGTGCFLMMNTGTEIVPSTSGLLTTVAYRLGKDQATVYALEGSIAMAGALVQWLRDNLQVIKNSSEAETLATAVQDNGGVYFVPAFSGLFAPHWRDDARGVIVGMTSYCNRNHIVRAALESVAYQTYDVVQAMINDSKDLSSLKELKVDGGMVVNEFLMQFQADVLGQRVIRPKITETTAKGAAMAAGLATGYWTDLASLAQQWQVDRVWTPTLEPEVISSQYRQWQKAIRRTLNWVEEEEKEEENKDGP